MASITMNYGTLDEINATAKVEGQLLFSTDQNPNDKIYFDKDATTRIVLGGKDEVDTALNPNSNNPISNSAVAGVMLQTVNEVESVTTNGQLVDALAVKALINTVNNLQTQVTNYWKNIYPIGSVYISVNSSFNPNTAFGGTWVRIQDRFLLASGSSYTNGNMGGEATHTLTINEMPSHNHNPLRLAYGGATASPEGLSYSSTSVGDKNFNWLSSQGGNQAHNNMPPYLVVMVWKRTA